MFLRRGHAGHRDTIGIVYVDEDVVMVGEGVIFQLGKRGLDGLPHLDDPTAPDAGAPGEVHETLRYPE
jgi:hypothetical protein